MLIMLKQHSQCPAHVEYPPHYYVNVNSVAYIYEHISNVYSRDRTDKLVRVSSSDHSPENIILIYIILELISFSYVNIIVSIIENVIANLVQVRPSAHRAYII